MTNRISFILEEDVEQSAIQEIEELIKKQASSTNKIVSVDCENNELYTLLAHAQTPRRMLLTLAQVSSIKEINELDLTDIFAEKEMSYVIEVEGVRGQDNRIELAKAASQPVLAAAKKQDVTLNVDYKQPQLTFILFYNGESYVLGLDLAGRELHKRKYRLFPHQASFRGDLGYTVMRASGYTPQNKILISFMKDAVLPIEAAIFATRTPLRQLNTLTITRIPKFATANDFVAQSNGTQPQIYAFDEGTQAYMASRKNAKIAKVLDYLNIRKHKLDELDTKYQKDEFDHAIVFLTKKDEVRMNEIYYQTNHILKSGATLLFISREHFEPTVHSKYDLKQTTSITRGESTLKLTLLQKK